MVTRPWLMIGLAVACGTEAGVPSAALDAGHGLDATQDRVPDGGREPFDGGGPERPKPDIVVVGTLVEQLINAPSKSVNQTSWQGVASSRYVRLALFGDGFGSVSEIGEPEFDFSWLPSGDAAVSFSGNPWFSDLTIIEFQDSQTLIASSSGGGFGQRWDLTEAAPGRVTPSPDGADAITPQRQSAR